MYAPVPARGKKTDITRSRTGCLRCRRKRRKCDEEKPSCRRCASSGTDCEYGTMTLKFREATQWAAQKVDHRKATGTDHPHPPRSTSARSTAAATGQDQALQMHVSHLHEPSGQQSCQPTPPTSAEHYNCSADAELAPQYWQCASELTAQGEGCLSANSLTSGPGVDSAIFEQDYIVGNATADNPPSRWPDLHVNQLGLEFGTALIVGENGLLDRFLDFPESIEDARLSEMPCAGPKTLPQDITGPSPPGSGGGEEALGQTHVEFDRASQLSPHSCPDQSQQQQSPLSPTNQHPLRSHELQAQLPWPKVPKAPSKTKLSTSQRIYLAHFRVALTKAFPIELPCLWDLITKSEPVRCAALALAAANLANLKGKQLDDASGTWNAMPTHAAKATDFAAESLATLEGGSGLSLDARLVTMLLIIYYELEAGSMGNVFHTLSILNATILRHPDDVFSLPHGEAIVRWWIHLRSFAASAQSCHQLYDTESPVGALISDMETRVATPSQMIELIGTKGQRLWQRVLLTKCFRDSGDTPAEILKTFDDCWTILRGSQLHYTNEQYEGWNRLMDEDELYEELQNLKTTLEGCRPPTEFRPLLLTDQSRISSFPETTEPLRFSTHRRAMEVADFAFAQIICDEGLLRLLADSQRDVPTQFGDEQSTETPLFNP
ncbi:hypothetical protein NCS52_01312800 [Fusarium sp. LHS14.1]|nr:hypothetical protein NCS52_01312800 [Fusarium sp. LHS14.1]